ncbi:MAG: thiol-disulfide oxidoreductase YkuV [Armatimonadaceae bacterium]
MPLRTGTDMPELTGATEWLTPEVSREELIGSPTLIHFWATSCYICKNNMPILQEWKETYGPKGLKMVAVHAPRGEADLDGEKVRELVQEFHVTEPCAVDNDHALVERYQLGGYWPHYFLFDAEGKLRCRAAGDAGLKMIQATLDRLMASAS